jgi:hypothetical protein
LYSLAISTAKTIIEGSNRLSATIIAKYAKRHCVPLVIDAATIERRHFPDLMVLAPYSGLRSILYNSLEEELLTADDYGCLVAQAIEELRWKGVKSGLLLEIVCPRKSQLSPIGARNHGHEGRVDFRMGSRILLPSVISFSCLLAIALPTFRWFTNLKHFFEI